jgi:2-amino-4-hydroxy-6-hydroxymethyldihydropteridine diphosphokinase
LQRTQVTARSSLYRSEPVDAEGPDFVNAVVAVRTGLDAEQFLVALQRLETQAGRERPFPNAPRTLDLDLLMHGNSVIDTPTLTLPHPRMRERAFVLKPLAEIAPDKVPRAALARGHGPGGQAHRLTRRAADRGAAPGRHLRRLAPAGAAAESPQIGGLKSAAHQRISVRKSRSCGFVPLRPLNFAGFS